MTSKVFFLGHWWYFNSKICMPPLQRVDVDRYQTGFFCPKCGAAHEKDKMVCLGCHPKKK